jgi:hypothetical protein
VEAKMFRVNVGMMNSMKKRKTKIKSFKDKSLHRIEQSQYFKRINSEKKSGRDRK